jgi:predicted nucleic acid-binding protein
VASEPPLYADSSALVKLVLTEPQSRALGAYLGDRRVVTSEIALVEVVRAEQVADPPTNLAESAISLVDRIELVAVTRELLRRAAELTSERLRSLDAIHLATALAVNPDAVVAYDRRLLDAAEASGLRTVSPR